MATTPRPWRRSRSRRADAQILLVVVLVGVAIYSLRHALGVTTLLVFAVVVPSIILHEVAHGVAALAFGDDTAKRAGRLTLNPLAHVDPLGTLVLPAVLSLTGLGAFGYAKPVPINPARMRSPRNHAVAVSLAGPATNLALAGVSILLLRYARPAGTPAALNIAIGFGGLPAVDLVDRVIYLLGFLNVSLAVFNLIPLPPLDGSAVVERLIPPSAWPTWLKVRTYAMPVLLLVVLLDPYHIIARILDPAEQAWASLLAAS